jgi:meiosis induction protein kinase IME2/SME1
MMVESPNGDGGFDRAIKDVNALLDDPNALLSKSGSIRRNPSFPPTPNGSRAGESVGNGGVVMAPISSRTRRSIRNARQRYETPDENDELVGEVLAAASGKYRQHKTHETPTKRESQRDLRHQAGGQVPTGYPTPSPQMTNRHYPSPKAMDVVGRRGRREEDLHQPKLPTPPSEGDRWGVAAYQAVVSRR